MRDNQTQGRLRFLIRLNIIGDVLFAALRIAIFIYIILPRISKIRLSLFFYFSLSTVFLFF